MHVYLFILRTAALSAAPIRAELMATMARREVKGMKGAVAELLKLGYAHAQRSQPSGELTPPPMMSSGRKPGSGGGGGTLGGSRRNQQFSLFKSIQSISISSSIYAL
jgi:hypothetical protein